MAPILFLVAILALTPPSSANWCVCKEGSDKDLQKTLDYACGAGADCNPIHQTGSCFQPNNVRAHCSYAANSFFQKKGQAAGTCDFSGTATVTTTDPSYMGCAYPASASGAGTSTTPTATTTPSTSLPSTTTPSTTNPYSMTPSNGMLGGINTGLGPAGVNTDLSHGGFVLAIAYSFLLTLLFSGFMLSWG